MPIIKINSTIPFKKEQKKEMIDYTVRCVSEAIQVSPDVINVMFLPIAAEDVRFPTAVFYISWSKASARNRDAKEKIVADLTRKITEEYGIRPERVVIFFLDLPGEDVGVAGKLR